MHQRKREVDLERILFQRLYSTINWGSFIYYAVFLDNIHGDFLCKMLLKEVINKLNNYKENSANLQFVSSLNNKAQNGKDLESQILMLKSGMLYFKYLDDYFAFVIPWNIYDTDWLVKTDKPFLIKLNNITNNDLDEFYTKDKYTYLCDIDVKNDENDSESMESLKNLVRKKAEDIFECIKHNSSEQ